MTTFTALQFFGSVKTVLTSIPSPLTWPTLLSLITGLLVALSMHQSLIIYNQLYPLITFIHELGHTLSSWLVGYPALPQFVRTPQVTLANNQSTVILTGVYGCFGLLAIIYRHNSAFLKALLFIILGYSVFTLSDLSHTFILFMGHGSELCVAGGLLYQTLRPQLGWIKKVFYAACGWFILIYDFILAYKLIYDTQYQMIYTYHQGYRQGGDLSRLASIYFDQDLTTVAWLFGGCCILVLIVNGLLYCYSAQIQRFFERH